jgi:hypothetical protein
MDLERALPGEQLFLRKGVPAASLLHCDIAAAQRCKDGGFAASHPSIGVRRRQITH